MAEVGTEESGQEGWAAPWSPQSQGDGSWMHGSGAYLGWGLDVEEPTCSVWCLQLNASAEGPPGTRAAQLQ